MATDQHFVLIEQEVATLKQDASDEIPRIAAKLDVDKAAMTDYVNGLQVQLNDQLRELQNQHGAQAGKTARLDELYNAAHKQLCTLNSFMGRCDEAAAGGGSKGNGGKGGKGSQWQMTRPKDLLP